MRKSELVLLSTFLLSGALPCASALADTLPASPQSYEVKEFFADFKHFTIGDVVPDIYRSKTYEIDQWQIRHLPAPQPGSHWTYMGGDYVLISDAEGKILRAEAGDIFYRR